MKVRCVIPALRLDDGGPTLRAYPETSGEEVRTEGIRGIPRVVMGIFDVRWRTCVSEMPVREMPSDSSIIQSEQGAPELTAVDLIGRHR